MSIVTDITRIMNAKADIKTAIEEKGVEVGDGLIDTYAGKIAEITGGGGDDYRTQFWNGFQENGARTNFADGFRGWKNMHNYWCPIHDINPIEGSMMFYNATSNLGLPEMCEKAGINQIDWSKVQTFNQVFSYAKIPDIGVIDTRGSRSMSSILASSYVQKAHLILKEDGSQGAHSGAFTNATKLTDLTIEGKIGDTVNLSTCTNLSTDSMKSVIMALLDWRVEDDTMVDALTCGFSTNQWETLEASGKAPDGGTWEDYVISKGWLT